MLMATSSRCRMPLESWVGCAAQGCHAGSPSTECLSCIANLQPYQPAFCPDCVAAVAAFLRQLYLMGFEPHNHLFQQCWRNLQKLMSKAGVMASWTNTDLPLLLSLGQARASPTLSLHAQLRDLPHPKALFFGFPPSAPAGGPAGPHPSTPTHSPLISSSPV